MRDRMIVSDILVHGDVRSSEYTTWRESLGFFDLMRICMDNLVARLGIFVWWISHRRVSLQNFIR